MRPSHSVLPERRHARAKDCARDDMYSANLAGGRGPKYGPMHSAQTSRWSEAPAADAPPPSMRLTRGTTNERVRPAPPRAPGRSSRGWPTTAPQRRAAAAAAAAAVRPRGSHRTPNARNRGSQPVASYPQPGLGCAPRSRGRLQDQRTGQSKLDSAEATLTPNPVPEPRVARRGDSIVEERTRPRSPPPRRRWRQNRGAEGAEDGQKPQPRQKRGAEGGRRWQKTPTSTEAGRGGVLR
eukprot:scaffold841_cov397-Prasinococcus_capsulatus_cf.AAC.11